MGLNQIQVELVSFWGSDRDAANQAWASSYDVDTLAKKSDDDVRRVVTTIATHGHTTPMERLYFDLFLTVPVFVERQMDKYRMTVQHQNFRVDFEGGSHGRFGITQNELSGRYRTIPERRYTMPKDVESILERAFVEHPVEDEIAIMGAVFQVYNDRLAVLKKARDKDRLSGDEYKRAREVLRGMLPVATLTDMRWVLNLNALTHVLNQRLAPEAQLECRVTAAKMYRAVEGAKVAPVLLEELSRKHGWDGLVTEIEALVEEDR